MAKAVNVCGSPPLKDDLHFTLACFTSQITSILFRLSGIPMHKYQQLPVDALFKTVQDFQCKTIQIKQIGELEKKIRKRFIN